MGGHPNGLAEGSYTWFCFICYNNNVINLIVLLLVFSTAVANGDQNSIHL
jgi:hypothetical protein